MLPGAAGVSPVLRPWICETLGHSNGKDTRVPLLGTNWVAPPASAVFSGFLELLDIWTHALAVQQFPPTFMCGRKFLFIVNLHRRVIGHLTLLKFLSREILSMHSPR